MLPVVSAGYRGPVLALTDARVYGAEQSARALLIDDAGRIAAVAADAGAWPGVRSVALQGRPVLPGFVDAHLHLRQLAARARALTFTGRESARDLVHAAQRRTDELPVGAWILGYGYDDSTWTAQLNRAELDAAAPYHPVFLQRKDAHSGLANTLALRRAGIPEDVPDPEGGRFERDLRGRLTGVIKERALRPILNAIPDPAGPELEVLVLQTLRDLARMGITTVCTIGDQAEFAVLEALRQRRALPIRVCQFLGSEYLDEVRSSGLRSGSGDERLWFGGLKFFADGSLGSRTAWLEQPYEGTQDCGISTIDPLTLQCEVGAANAAGIAVAVHAIGDRALRVTLEALEAASPDAAHLEVQGFQNRIEHVQLGHPEQFERMARLRVIASMQPLHAPADRVLADRCWGSRCRQAYAWRMVRDAGVTLAFGSDSPVESADPLLGLHAAVTRQDLEGRPVGGWYPEQRLSLDEALAAYGSGAAQAVGRGRRLGTLRPGRWADLVVLTGDPVFGGSRVEATYVAGQLVTNENDPPPASR